MGRFAAPSTMRRVGMFACLLFAAALLVWWGVILGSDSVTEDGRLEARDPRAVDFAALSLPERAALTPHVSHRAGLTGLGPNQIFLLDHGNIRLVRLRSRAGPQQRWLILSVASLVGASLVLLQFLVLRRRQRQRLRVLAEALEEIGRGRLTHRLPIMNEGDDLDRVLVVVNATLDRLSRLMEMLQEQSDHIRHEYGNSAGRMGVFLASINDLGEPLPCAAREAISALERERLFFIALTEAILNLWQARQGGQEMHVQDLAILAGEVVDVSEGRAEEKSIRLIDELRPALVLGDARMLTLMISNLLDNALKYTPTGGVARLSCAVAGRFVRLRLEDSGPGVPPDKRQLVFEPRERLAETAALQGKGYGLAIVKAIAELHFGRIEIRETDLGGACFEIELPLAENSGAQVAI